MTDCGSAFSVDGGDSAETFGEVMTSDMGLFLLKRKDTQSMLVAKQTTVTLPNRAAGSNKQSHRSAAGETDGRVAYS
mgnify:CR=1 FL=1